MSIFDTVIRCPSCGCITDIEFFEIDVEKYCSQCGKHKFKDFNIVTENGEIDVKWSERNTNNIIPVIEKERYYLCTFCHLILSEDDYNAAIQHFNCPSCHLKRIYNFRPFTTTSKVWEQINERKTKEKNGNKSKAVKKIV